jgi:hypothetical protein
VGSDTKCEFGFCRKGLYRQVEFQPHDPEKACPALDAGWSRFSEKIMRKQKDRAR